MTTTLVSKVLVLDDGCAMADGLKSFYSECGLVGIRPPHGDETAVVNLLKSNVDLGGIMLYENFGGTPGNGVAMARAIHASRPELPLFLRRDAIASMAGLDERDGALFRCAYAMADLQPLRASLEASIFSRVYPNDLVRGISEFTRASLETLFRNCEVTLETPYLVKDRIIYGEVFTMIAIDSSWCRGYMMLQCEEAALLELVRREQGDDLNFRDLNNVLGEATNLVWGSFKNRYTGDGDAAPNLTQVPIIINHHRRYISFGSDDPQLCLRYVLRERGRADAQGVPVLQRFVFNLRWNPEQFRENPSIESLVNAGELEMF